MIREPLAIPHRIVTTSPEPAPVGTDLPENNARNAGRDIYTWWVKSCPRGNDDDMLYP